MATPDDERPDGEPLSEKIWNLFVYLPAGFAAAAADELPKLVARGREELGVRVSSARAVGKLAVRTGRGELRRRSSAVRPTQPAGGRTPPPPERAADGGGTPEPAPERSAPSTSSTPPPGGPASNGYVPAVTTLAIPGFDTLSASQVVQRLDGLSRGELVSVRAYETSTRGRRTILNRIDQLLDERS